mgnify:CR=1 FL=1
MTDLKPKTITKCVTVTPEQDQKIRVIQLRRMTAERKTISYSSVIHQAIDEGLERMH